MLGLMVSQILLLPEFSITILTSMILFMQSLMSLQTTFCGNCFPSQFAWGRLFAKQRVMIIFVMLQSCVRIKVFAANQTLEFLFGSLVIMFLKFMSLSLCPTLKSFWTVTTFVDACLATSLLWSNCVLFGNVALSLLNQCKCQATNVTQVPVIVFRFHVSVPCSRSWKFLKTIDTFKL